MNYPIPQLGLVVSYWYLWEYEKALGQEHGKKARPCAILFKAPPDRPPLVGVAPITQRDPEDTEISVQLPSDQRQRIGLDGEPQWIIINEFNFFTWPGPELNSMPSKGGAYDYGLLAPEDYDDAVEKYKALLKSRRVRFVPRDEKP